MDCPIIGTLNGVQRVRPIITCVLGSPGKPERVWVVFVQDQSTSPVNVFHASSSPVSPQASLGVSQPPDGVGGKHRISRPQGAQGASYVGGGVAGAPHPTRIGKTVAAGGTADIRLDPPSIAGPSAAVRGHDPTSAVGIIKIIPPNRPY